MEIAAARQADATQELQAEFDDRFEMLRRRLTSICMALAGSDNAPDLVHETYLRARDRLHQLRDPALFDAWVVRIAIHEAKGLTRRARRERERLPRIHRKGHAASPDTALRELVERLPARQRAVIALYGDIAQHMWLIDARGTAESNIWMATIGDETVVDTLEWWRNCIADEGVYFADPQQAFSAALKYAQSGDHSEERNIATADAYCKVESGLDRAVNAAFLAAINTVLPNLEADLIALQELEEDALIRAKEILATAE